MNSVPDRGGPHRGLIPAVQSMYEAMPDNQLKSVHSQAQHIMEHGKVESLKPKFEERLKYTTPEMEKRGLSSQPTPTGKNRTQYGEPATKGGSINPSKDFKPSTWHR